MRSMVRPFLLLPALIVAMVVIPTMVLFAASGAPGADLAGIVTGAREAGAVDLSSISAFQSPLPPGTVPPGTVPPPTPRPRPRPTTVVVPRAPAVATTPSDRATIYPYEIEKVIGDRLSPTIYAFIENGALYRSDDDGRIWTLVTARPKRDDFLMSSADPNVLYSGDGVDCADPVAGNAPMYRSDDGGFTWDELPTGINLRPLLIDPANPDVLFASDCAMLYLSTDGGMSWTSRADNSEARLWETYRVVAMTSASLVGDPVPAVPHWDQLYAAGNNASGEGVITFTGDQGGTWANITDPERAPMSLITVVADLYRAGHIWMLAENGVWATEDFGVDWQFSDRGLRSLTRTASAALTDLTYATNGKLYLGTSQGVFEKPINGEMWTRVVDTGFTSKEVVNFLLTETSPRNLWVNTDDGVFTYYLED